MDRRELIQELRVQVGAVRTDAAALAGLSIGVEEIDEHLPGGGLARGALHEFVGGDDDLRHGAAPAFLAATVLGREGKAVLWVMSREDLFPAGIAGGLDPDRILFVETGREDEVLPVVEEGLRHRGLAVVVAEVEQMTLRSSRRLQLAAEGSGVPAVVIRRSRGIKAPDLHGTASTTRWRLSPAPSAPLGGVPGVGAPRWRLELLRCRGGRPGCWMVEVSLETGGLRLVAALADRSASAPSRRGAAA